MLFVASPFADRAESQPELATISTPGLILDPSPLGWKPHT
jgi:hypothetical protein